MSKPVPPNRTNRRGIVSSNSKGFEYDLSDLGQLGTSLDQAEEALKEVNRDWEPIVSLEFNPVPLALDLLDDSSLGRDMTAFHQLLKKLNQSVESVVNDHYKQFNSTTTIFTGVQAEINESQQVIREMKLDLNRSKEVLSTHRTDLNGLWSKAKQYKEMLRILDKLDEIKKVPGKLEELFRDKYYLTGIRLLLKTLNEINSDELKPIKATSEVKRSLYKLKETLHETLIEEIHNHVYLKIHLTEEFDNLMMFSNKAKFQELVSNYLDNDFDEQYLPTTPTSTISLMVDNNNSTENRIGDRVELSEDLTVDAESDPLNFLRMIIISLKLINKLPEAIDRMKSRVPVELYQLVDKTVNEIEIKIDKGDFNLSSTINNNQEEINSSVDGVKHDTLKAFMVRLYKKFQLVLANHQFIVLLIQSIYSKPGMETFSPFQDQFPTLQNPTNLNKRLSRLRLNKEAAVPSYNLKEVWKSMQTEIKSLLNDYLTDHQLRNLAAVDTLSSISDAMRGRVVKDPKKPLFRFTDRFAGEPTSNRLSNYDMPITTPFHSIYSPIQNRVTSSAGSAKAQRQFGIEPADHLNLLDHVPNQPITSDRLAINLTSIAVDKFSLTSQLNTEHRLLCPADVFNISALFPPTAAFFEVAQGFLGFKDDDYLDLENFLKDFFNLVFLPQMELKAQQHLMLATTGQHAFQISSKHFSPHGKPLLECVAQLVTLVQNLCHTLQSLPFQKEEYIKVIEHILEGFLEKCNQCYRNLVQCQPNLKEEDLIGNNNRSGSILSAGWANSDELKNIFNMLVKGGNLEVLEQEIDSQLKLKQKRSLHPSELLFDIKKISLLATLSHSLNYFVKIVSDLIGNKETEISNQKGEFNNNNNNNRPPTIRSMSIITSQFDHLLSRFIKLSDLTLFTLRVEIRCHVMYYLDLAVRESNYYLEYDQVPGPDSYITSLNGDLTRCECGLKSQLIEKDLNFVFQNISSFMAHGLISSDNVRNIRKLSMRGVDKMRVNIAALHQNLSNLGIVGNGLKLAEMFYGLYSLDLEGLTDRAKSQPSGLSQFTYHQYKALLDLILETLTYEQTIHSQTNADPLAMDLIIQSYSEQLMQLRELTSNEEMD